ncbi:hypothetical protein T4E_8805 [Trichinella pseudospiralis]|uniref:Uncharacterized protein n=1 Tax=Trichinella pseudospiralis TaxID=6337 RepID=A0A0V0XFT6_TRIPS|nr:hypothetical protein T4E_11437 [Trichinella pseudospiralis]KRX86452.1 hypothetical protein T4E_8805 [Trichinella pseudospiralis]
MKEVVTTCNYNNNLTETQKEPESSDSELNEKKQAFAHKLRITERNLFPNLSSASAPNLSPTSLPENKPLFSSPRRASNPTRPGIFSERTSKMNAQLATPSACNSDPPHRRQMTKVDSWNAHYWALTSMWANQTGSVTVRRPSATQIEPKTLANGFVEMKEQRANARLKSSPDSDGYNSSTCSSESAETVRQKKTAQRVGKRHRRRKSLDLLSSSFTRSMEDGNSSSSDELDSAARAFVSFCNLRSESFYATLVCLNNAAQLLQLLQQPLLMAPPPSAHSSDRMLRNQMSVVGFFSVHFH